ncbi:glycosyltransferase [Kaistella sp.]|uniref:glycosyltransferase n=1 Tax=Kaistella sp. TaxID=2782235 RepID=UPI003C36F1D9
MSIKKKIAIISPSLKMGGIERALTVLANYFASLGHHVIFISCQASNSFYQLEQEVQLYEFTYERKSGLINKVKFYYNLITYLRKKVAEVNPDCVLSFGDVFNPLVLLALYQKKVPVFISDRTSPDFPFNPVVKFGKKWLYPNSTGFIAQTERAAKYKKTQFNNRLNIKIIPNAIKPVAIHPTISREQQIIYVGRLSKEKGVARLVQAFSKIKNKNWKLVLAGDGPETGRLHQLVEELQLQNRVVFLGKVNEVDVLLAQSSIFVLPSFLEGFPNALCEAMSAGLPSICFDCIPHEELIVDGDNGFVVKDGDLSALALVIDRLAEDENYRIEIGQNAAKISDKLSLDFIGKDYLKFICNTK